MQTQNTEQYTSAMHYACVLLSLAPLAAAIRFQKEQANVSLAGPSYTLIGSQEYCYDPGTVTEIFRELTFSPEQCRAKCDSNPDCGAYHVVTGGTSVFCGSGGGGACYGFSACSGTNPSDCMSIYSAAADSLYVKDPTPASATGDPHLQNIHGERFDLTKPGVHTLINIPRGAADAVLRVQADARQLGNQCADLYFQELNVTGIWAEEKQAGGYRYSVTQGDVEIPGWIEIGNVELKVVRGHTNAGLLYLNVFVKHLGRTGFSVGGLLGEDDHRDVSAPPSSCVQHVRLAMSVGAL